VPNFSLEGQTAVVTGGSKGIGRAIARTFADAGAAVALAARGQEALDATVREIEEAGGRAIGVPTDVGDREQVRGLVDAALEAFGTVDILVNNAGSAPFLSTLDQIREAGFEKHFKPNFFSALYCTKAVGPILLEKGSGCVLNVASIAGVVASPGLSYYASAKAAMISLTKTTALEWAGSGVRANAVAPGWVETDINERARRNAEFLRETTASIPLGRWGHVDDVAAAALYLCSPAASWVTGAVLMVDGGQLVTNTPL
jgi:NAD(P)-dependent dehydrogenase (short-subunit alcohol dehydrogenase family)